MLDKRPQLPLQGPFCRFKL